MAAAGLAYYGYSYSRALSIRERALIMDTTRELAEEKVIGIETELIKSDHAIFNRVNINNLSKFQEVLRTERPAIESAMILDEDLVIIPGGFFAKPDLNDLERYREFLFKEIIPDLELRRSKLNQRGHLHKYYDGRPRLFSHIRRRSKGKTFHVVLEADLAYLVSTVFPQFFGIRSPRLYQVVETDGGLIYGFDFTRIPRANIVEIPFPETVDQWRLRVAQRDAAALSTGGSREAMDLVLIGSALAVIVAGLAILVLGLRRERRANELKSEFISNVSHELKTPLSIISMFGELLALGRTRSPEQAAEYAEIIWKESVRLARLIDNVLDFAKIERGANAYEFAEGDVAEVALRAVELSSRRLQGADMEVNAEVAEDLPLLSIDSNALTLAVLNLIDNAAKYAAEGKRIEVAVQQEGSRVEVLVRDFGPGIAPEEQAHIFERFYRAKDVRLKPIRGSGIGLALVKHIAVAHGGDITVTSEPGKGAAFRLWIPVPSRVK
jgi:two-component system phosphate regulon sensor histidine kinase PhoR